MGQEVHSFLVQILATKTIAKAMNCYIVKKRTSERSKYIGSNNRKALQTNTVFIGLALNTRPAVKNPEFDVNGPG